jgi:O-methyltransferase
MINKILRPLNLQLVKIDFKENKFPDFEPDFNKIMNFCKPFSMTSEERLYAVNKAIDYVVKNNIKGDIIECGVWRGGSSMCAMLSLLSLNNNDRTFYLYDTFEGMTEPTEQDKDSLGNEAKTYYENRKKTTDDMMWCYAPIDDVKKNIRSTNYPENLVNYVKGKVEETIPETTPESIAVLRLDTDWYESTYHEMVHLFPKLVKGGVLIIDDYGHWTGARKAVDQYFKENNIQMLLNRVDYTCRMGIKF